jgi:hypothetical protein
MTESTLLKLQSPKSRRFGFRGLTNPFYQSVRGLLDEWCGFVGLLRANAVPVTECIADQLARQSAEFIAKLTLTAFLSATYKSRCKAYLLPRGGMFCLLRELTGNSGSFAFNLPIAGGAFGSLTGSSLLTSVSAL